MVDGIPCLRGWQRLGQGFNLSPTLGFTFRLPFCQVLGIATNFNKKSNNGVLDSDDDGIIFKHSNKVNFTSGLDLHIMDKEWCNGQGICLVSVEQLDH